METIGFLMLPHSLTSFEIHVPEDIKESVVNKKIIDNIFRVQANNSIMFWYLCIGFIDFMLAG